MHGLSAWRLIRPHSAGCAAMSADCLELNSAMLLSRTGTVLCRSFPLPRGWVSSLSGDGESITVEGCTFRKLVADVGHVDLLKVDIEGAERSILDDRALQRVGAVVGEYHDSGDAKEREAFFAGLRKHFDLTVGETAALIAFSCGRRLADCRGSPKSLS